VLLRVTIQTFITTLSTRCSCLVLTQHATARSSWLAGSVCSPTGCAAPCCGKHRCQGSGCCRQASRHERCCRMGPKASWTPSPSLVSQLPARRVQKDVKGTVGPKLTVGCQVNIMTFIMSIGLASANMSTDATSMLWLQSVPTTPSPAHMDMLFISARSPLLLYQAAQHPAAVCKPRWYTVAQANSRFYQLAGISHIPTCSRPAWLCCVGDAWVEGIAGVWPSAQLLLNLLGVNSTPPAISTTILAGRCVC
jgi:hypothetical protein